MAQGATVKKEHGDQWYRFVYRGLYDIVHKYGIGRNYVNVEFILD